MAVELRLRTSTRVPVPASRSASWADQATADAWAAETPAPAKTILAEQQGSASWATQGSTQAAEQPGGAAWSLAACAGGTSIRQACPCVPCAPLLGSGRGQHGMAAPGGAARLTVAAGQAQSEGCLQHHHQPQLHWPLQDPRRPGIVVEPHRLVGGQPAACRRAAWGAVGRRARAAWLPGRPAYRRLAPSATTARTSPPSWRQLGDRSGQARA